MILFHLNETKFQLIYTLTFRYFWCYIASNSLRGKDTSSWTIFSLYVSVIANGTSYWSDLMNWFSDILPLPLTSFLQAHILVVTVFLTLRLDFHIANTSELNSIPIHILLSLFFWSQYKQISISGPKHLLSSFKRA